MSVRAYNTIHYAIHFKVSSQAHPTLKEFNEIDCISNDLQHFIL